MKKLRQREEEEIRQIDLTKADDCREFLGNIRVDGRDVKSFYTSKGRKITVADMSDEEAIYFANQIHSTLFDGNEHINTDIYREDHH